MCGNRNNVTVPAPCQQFQVRLTVESAIQYEEDVVEFQQFSQIGNRGFVIARSTEHPGKQGLLQIDIIPHEVVDLILAQIAELVSGFRQSILI